MEVRRKIRHAFTQMPRIKLDMDESPPKPDEPVSPLFLTNIQISLLINKQDFTLHAKSGSKKQIKLQLSSSLLSVYMTGDTEKTLSISEIKSVEESQFPFNRMNSDFELKHFYLSLNTLAKAYLLSTFDEKLRNGYVSGLYRVLINHQDFQTSDVLKNYCEKAIEVSKIEKSLKTLKKSCKSVVKEQVKLKLSIQENELRVVEDMMSFILTQVDVSAKCDECKNYEINFKRNVGDIKSLSLKQEELRESIRIKEEQIERFQDDLNLTKQKIFQFYKKLKLGSFGVITRKIWQKITIFLNFRDIFVLIGVNQRIRKLTNMCLSVKHIWRVLSLSGLVPRKFFYRVYMQNFYRTRIRGIGYEINQNVLLEIHNDVWNGLNEYQIETEEIIISLCKYNPSLEYCQGMHFVSNFLYILFRNIKEVIETMDSLCRPPFYLSELWKNDFSRLKLGIYQLDFLLKIKIPLLANHFKKLDIHLDMIVSRWLLTVFTHFYYQFDSPLKDVLQIWDIFLIYGWSGLISTCLAIFYLIEDKILEKDYEGTLLTLTSKSNLSGLFTIIQKFIIDPRLLEDLDSSYATIN